MKGIKPLLIIVVLLIVVNCALIGMLWFTNYHKRPPVMQGQAFDYITKELKLNPQQVKQYTAMRTRHHEATQTLGNEQRMQRDSFFDALKNPDVTPTEVNAMEKRILNTQAKLDSATFYHFKNFRAILNTTQQSRFDEIIKDVLHMMSRPQGGPGRQGPGMGNGQQQGPPNGPPPNGERLQKRGPKGQLPPPPGFPPDGARHNGPPPNGGPPFRPPPPPGVGPPPNGEPPDGPPNGPPPQGNNK